MNSPQTKPRKVNSFRTLLFFMRDFKDLSPLLQSEINRLKADGWSFSVVDQRCGYMNYGKKILCIPTWICEPKERPGGYIQYIAHEIAHATHREKTSLQEYNKQDAHGPEFMEEMKRLCPPEYWHHELSYKPLQASASGISKDVSQNIANGAKQFPRT